ncbi:MAG: PKD domain-containing protein, partial [Holophagales bacterium]|nr:PKD domain-containing protein [Holophagales bacterium]
SVEGATCDAELCHALTGDIVRFADTSAGAVRSRLWEFGDGNTSRSGAPAHTWSSPGFYEVTLEVSDGTSTSRARRVFLIVAAEPKGTCIADAETRCLQDSRYAVTVEWWLAGGERHASRVVHQGTNDSGLFWFFDPNNWEVLLKVLDGCAVNDHVWVFGASTTDLGYAIRVTDTVTGAVKEYRNTPGMPAAALTDVAAFPDVCGSGPAAAPVN